MTYITTALTIIVTLLAHETQSEDFNTHTLYLKEYTRNMTLKQGYLQGMVLGFRTSRALPPIEQYLGIPYAAPPVGELRFMPSGSSPSWFGTKMADTYGPVCPQKFPNIQTMSRERRDEFYRLQKYLLNQSEDCLYLNIYAPYQGSDRTWRSYPVMVYIHGESFEWNSGNPYDGSVLAAVGKVIVVTLNYRLGILGFLKAGTEEHSRSNFGLVDQIAGLLWVKENIATFGGDPNSITLFGHGTGAACAGLLMLSPMVLQAGDKTLFQRAILMGGSALSDWALAGNPRDVTYQVAQKLNCQIHEDFAQCLRRKRLDELMAAAPVTLPFRTRFGPLVDSLVVPNEPRKLMTTYNDIFRRFELLYGVTEIESLHLLGPEALQLGMLEKDRDQELRKYLRSKCERRPELCLTQILAKYSPSEFGHLEDEKFESYTGQEPDWASRARDVLLDILSDGRTVAPVVQMGKFHAALNLQSYFYVFTQKTQEREYLRDMSFTGQEVPYVFGVPIAGPTFHFTDHYSEKERMFSEIIMTYFCNFAYTGDPNMPRKDKYYTLNQTDLKFEVDWPEFDLKQQQYLQLGIPPYILDHYRDDKMRFWNDVFPVITYNNTYNPIRDSLQTDPSPPRKSVPPWILSPATWHNGDKATRTPSYGSPMLTGTREPGNMQETVYGTVIYSPNNDNRSVATTVSIVIGSIFLVCNLCFFLVLYLRRVRKRKRVNAPKSDDLSPTPEEANDQNSKAMSNGCNLIKMVSKSSRSDDTYEVVGGKKLKLPRQMSSSTIDAHTKVRDWITNEIVHKYSPRILRRPRNLNEVKIHADSTETTALDNSSTLGRSPTRPVSPSDNIPTRPPLVKSSSIPVQKTKPEKVSVAVDATPAGRGNSVLQQQPIELTKSLDRAPLRRSLTLDDFSTITPEPKQELRKSTTGINLQVPPPEPTVIKIGHCHSRSEPVQDIYASTATKKLRTFDPHSDVNVTSREESVTPIALTPEESLQTIKRRNFPKVLPDYPSREALARKRRSMPVTNIFMPIPEIAQSPNSFSRFPPAPPVRKTSTLTRRPMVPQPRPPHLVCQSAPMLAQEPSPSPEPEVACNNLYIGPIVPKLSSSESSKLNTHQIYDSLKSLDEVKKVKPPLLKTVITTDPDQPIKKMEPKVIIKPSMTRSLSDPKKNIPRVNLQENYIEEVRGKEDEEEEEAKEFEKHKRSLKPSQIPTPVNGSKESSSSDSTPSEGSDTGTVVKRP